MTAPPEPASEESSVPDRTVTFMTATQLQHLDGPDSSTRSPSTSSSRPARRRPPEVLTEAEAVALIKACSNRAPTGIRNRALIAVLWRCWAADLRSARARAPRRRPRDRDDPDQARQGRQVTHGRYRCPDCSAAGALARSPAWPRARGPRTGVLHAAGRMDRYLICPPPAATPRGQSRHRPARTRPRPQTHLRRRTRP